MITLTTPAQINSVLGGNVPVDYDKLVIAPFTMNAVDQTVSARIRLTSTTVPTMQPIIGSLHISVPLAELVIQVEQLDFYRRIVLTSAQNTAVLNQIESAQGPLESGLVSLGLIAGIRTAGA